MIKQVIDKLKLNEKNYQIYLNKFAKLSLPLQKPFSQQGKLIVVTSINPTPAGEGKTTLLIGLVDALNHYGHNAIGALREPSLGPVFGMKGTATGGGQTALANENDINLHFTGDFHAITTANNLISTIIENEIFFNTTLNIDKDKILWKRCLDMNDRGLREINVNLGQNRSYTTGFNITAASDLMALFCLVNDAKEFELKLSNTIVAYDQHNRPITIRDLSIVDAIMSTLHHAFEPNLAYTNHLNPIIIHGGPFANIAHGCNSIIATKTALTLADYTITECGFGSDLGFEKFMNIKMQTSGLKPNLVIICATIKALKYHGTPSMNSLVQLTDGFNNLIAHVEHVKSYNLNPLVVLNIHANDTTQEIEHFNQLCLEHNIDVAQSDMYINGAKNAQSLVNTVIDHIQNVPVKFMYNVKSDSLIAKITKICASAYHTSNIQIDDHVLKVLKQVNLQDYFVCIAKTQYSLTSNDKILNYPKNGQIVINRIEINHAAKLVIPICGTIWKMPGLPKDPLAKTFK